MQIKNYFTPNKSTILYRKNRKKILLKQKIKVTENFKRYGFDYFDNKNIKSGYDKYINDGRYISPVKKIIKNFNLKKNETICEFGCAKGFMLEEFKKLGFRVLGFEISNYAKKKSNIGKSIKIIKKTNDIENYKFDFLISKNVLPHLNSLKNINQLIKISIKKSIHKPYFIIHTFKSDKDKKLFLKWDRTHKILFNITKWKDFLKKYDKKILYSFDVLF